jgi:hypothetical protein
MGMVGFPASAVRGQPRMLMVTRLHYSSSSSARATPSKRAGRVAYGTETAMTLGWIAHPAKLGHCLPSGQLTPKSAGNEFLNLIPTKPALKNEAFGIAATLYVGTRLECHCGCVCYAIAPVLTRRFR